MAIVNISFSGNWSYICTGDYEKIGSYTNSGSNSVYVNSLSIRLGTLNGYTSGYGITVTGSGSAISTNIRANSTVYSGNQLVSNQVSVASAGYPDKDDTTSYTFTFPENSVLVSPGSTVTFYISTPSTDPGNTGEVLVADDDANIQLNVETYVPIQYTVTYDANGGTGAPAAQTKNYNQAITLSSQQPSKSYTVTYNANGGSVSPASKSVACTFLHWNTKADGSGTSYSSGGQYTANASVTLYAIYQNNAIGALPTPTRNNCRFNAWTTTLNGSTEVTDSTIVSASMTIYAKWDYAVVFNGNGGTVYRPEESPEVSESFTLYKTHGVDLIIPDYEWTYSEPDFDGTQSREFIGFSTSASSASIQYENGDHYTQDAPVTLYAIYETLKFTVTFEDGYSGTVLRTYTDVPYGGSVTPPPNPTRTGYVFQGWLGNYTNVMADSTILALWEFTPIWIMTTNGWVRYEPSED